MEAAIILVALRVQDAEADAQFELGGTSASNNNQQQQQQQGQRQQWDSKKAGEKSKD